MSTRLTFSGYKQMRWFSTKQKMEVIDTVNKSLSNNRLKHKEHPGILKPRQVQQPSWLADTVRNILHDRTVSLQVISASSKKLAAHLHNRKLPPEKKDIRLKMKEVQSRFNQHEMQDSNNDDEFKYSEANRLLKSIVYNWAPIQYDSYTSLAYLVNRSMPEYSVLYKIFNEIVNNDKNFMPKTLFDFGSGTGTVMWAASKFWVNSIQEYYCVDISKDMHELSEYLIKRAIPQVKPRYIFYRQFFPASPVPTYDIVVSAYSLFELPHQMSRLETISKLWHKTEQYLIIIEQGTNAGFKLVNEARDFILKSKKAYDAHVFSPCPHDKECPRYMTDKTPCNFEITYLTLPIGENSMYKRERYSYVVLKKGNRPENDCKWPRIVRQVLKRSRHVICRMCTSSGKLEEQIFTTWKSGKNTYRCARSSEWGDRLPFEIVKVEGEEKVEQEEEIEKEKEHT
ncbi:methyltransferase-like protein 17, mitochondrial [Bombus pascuorum]|uniref:methyltransferase-like protein 17, mitochondrial n=1 Tax=Bombus pascuorum TaxID=65598 RepID=UPI0021278293|nr:methyltransferase-like protein 17, mitochondrial [Bombus pascuorum]